MSRVYVTSDWHLGHKNIHKFRCKDKGFFTTFNSSEDHDHWLVGWALCHLAKRDTLICLGDMCFNEEALERLHSIPCRKILVKGNHDVIKSPLENKVYDQVHGFMKYKGFWLSHAPIHPQELRGKVNLHGHVHSESVYIDTGNITNFTYTLDNRYVNCCVEGLTKYFGDPCVEFEKIKEIYNG